MTAHGWPVFALLLLANARIHAHRVASVRDLPASTVLAIVDARATASAGALLGPRSVNVRAFNLALDGRGHR